MFKFRYPGLRGKLVFYLLMPSCLAIGSLLYLYNKDLNEALRQKFVEEAMLASIKLQAAISSEEVLKDTENIQGLISDFLSFYPQFLRVNVYAPAGSKGVVMASSDRAEIGTIPEGWNLSVFRSGRPQVREDTRYGQKVLGLSIPIIRDGKIFAAIGLYVPLAPMEVLVGHLRSRVFIVGPLGLGFLLLILYLAVNKMVVRPVRSLAQHAQIISAGNYQVRLPVKGEDEVARLGYSFNHMCSSIEETKQSLEQITRQNELILNSAGEGIYGLDLRGRTTFINPAGAKMIGWEVNDLIGKMAHEVHHHSKADGTPYHQEDCPIYAAFRDGKVHQGDSEIFWRRDGTSFPVEYISTPIWEHGSVIGVVVTFSDVTDRKLTEEALRESEWRLRRQNKVLVELAGHGSADHGDLKTGIKRITEAAANTLAVERVSVWLFHEGDSKILCVDQYELSSARHSAGMELAAEEYPKYFRALTEERTIAAHDAHNDYRTVEFSESYLSTFGITSMLDASIRLGGKIMGVVCHEHVGPKRKWSADEQNFAGSIADIVSLVMEGCERRRAEEALRESETRFAGILDIAHEAIISVDEEQRMIIFNKGAEQIFGYTQAEAVGQSLDLLMPERFQLVHRTHINSFAEYPVPARRMGERREISGRRKNGEEFPAEATISKLEVGGQKIFTVVLRDITDRKKAQVELEKSLSLLRATLESTADGILVVDNTGKILSFNQKFVNMWNIPETIIMSGDDNQALAYVLDQLKDPEGFLAKVRELYGQPEAESCDLLEFNDGRIFERFSQPHRSGGNLTGRVWSFRDISQRKQAEKALAEQAIRDSLTNLYNRRYFKYRMEEEIARADRNGHTLAVLMCDLDRFKVINDTRGHHVGDQVLKAAAKGIQESTRGTDLVFRWGGDEIVVVLADTTREGVLIAADRIRRAVHKIAEEGTGLDLSIGVALYPEHGRDLDELIRLADRALYIAKKGGDKIHIGEEEYQLDEHSVKVVFQVLMDVRTDEVLGYEALSRDPHGKLSILQLFKRYQAIGQLNELKRICFNAQLKAAKEAGLKRVFINVDFEVLQQLGDVPKPEGMEVILEISEVEALHDVENHLKIAKEWRHIGYKFAIDDFGAGFISLPFVAQLIPDYIKVDRSTLLQAVSSEEFRRFLKDLLQALRNYSKEGIVAEGIENTKELAVVKEIGISIVQGFLLGKPHEIKPLKNPG